MSCQRRGIISLFVQAQSGCKTWGRAPLIGNLSPGVAWVLARGNSIDCPLKKEAGSLGTWTRGLAGQCYLYK